MTETTDTAYKHEAAEIRAALSVAANDKYVEVAIKTLATARTAGGDCHAEYGGLIRALDDSFLRWSEELYMTTPDEQRALAAEAAEAVKAAEAEAAEIRAALKMAVEDVDGAIATLAKGQVEAMYMGGDCRREYAGLIRAFEEAFVEREREMADRALDTTG